MTRSRRFRRVALQLIPLSLACAAAARAAEPLAVAARAVEPPAAASPAASLPLRAYYKDDFILETPGGEFQLKVRGNLHLDLRAYQAQNRGAPHSFDLRRGRFDLMGRLIVKI